MNEKEMVEFWRRNEKPFGLCPKAAQEWFLAFRGPISIFCGDKWGEQTAKESLLIQTEKTYRLPPDYQPKPVGRWVECEVRVGYEQHEFTHPDGVKYFLYMAPGMVGFGGVEYEGWGWEDVLGAITKDGKICKPIRVKFWVEG